MWLAIECDRLGFYARNGPPTDDSDHAITGICSSTRSNGEQLAERFGLKELSGRFSSERQRAWG
jgi:hypothetical protein